MKKNISINISGIIFHIEEDGYATLQKYLDSINDYFSGYDESEEIIADIEGRIAEIFLQGLTDGKQVVSAEDVNNLIKTMGNITDFEAIEEEEDLASTSAPEEEQKQEQQQSTSGEKAKSTYNPSSRLYRDLNNQILGGVASGIAHYYKFDPIWMRIAFILFLPTGLSLIGYFILWIAIPGSNDLEEHLSIKKFYRDPDDRVLGGVCSGLAKYFNVDAIVVRIIFIILFIGGGTGLIAYIVLWIIGPEAQTITDRMQMKGERVTLSNIDENIKKKKTGEDFGPKDEGAFTKVLLFPFRLIGKVVSGISQALAPLMLFIVAVIRVFTGGIISIVGISGMFSILVTAGVLLGLYNSDWVYLDEDWTYFPHEVFSDTVPEIGVIALLIVIFIPFLFVFIAGITVIAKRKVMSGSMGWSILGVWLIAILITAVSIPGVVRDFQEEGFYETTEVLEVEGDTLVLELDRRYDYRRDNDIFFIDLDIRSSNTDEIVLESRIRSRGRTNSAAEDNAQMIEYNYDVSGSTIAFDDFFSFKPDGKYRGQELEMTLYIPEGKPFKVKRGMDEILGYFYRGYSWWEIYRSTWVFGENGLECISCAEDRPSRRRGSGSASADFDLRGINAIEIRDGFHVQINQGDFDVSFGSDRDMAEYVRFNQIGRELVIERKIISNIDDDEIRIELTLPSLTALEIEEDADVQMIGFNERSMRIRLFDQARLDMAATITSLDLVMDDDADLKINGSIDELTAEIREDAYLNAIEAQIRTTDLTTSSRARVRLTTSDYLKVDAGGRSSIEYLGSPELDVIRQSRSATIGEY